MLLNLVSGEGTETTVNSGEALSEAGTLKVTVSDEFQNAATAEIALTAVAVYGLEILSQLQLKVDEEINLMQGLTIAEGLTLQKVEIVQDGIHTVIDNPNSYTPEYPGSIDIVLTLARPDGSAVEVESNSLTVRPLDYQVPTINIVIITSDEHYSRYNNRINEPTREYIYPDVIISYDNYIRPKHDNKVHIMM